MQTWKVVITSYSIHYTKLYDFHEKHELVELEVNFVKEGVPYDYLGVRRQIIDEQNHICSVVRKSDGNDLIRARLVWGPRS